jgi:hypothetical protein
MLFKTKHPSVGYAYGVLTGTYVGEMLVFVETTDDVHKFISIPKNINREVPKDKFDFGLDSKIVEPVEKIPKQIFKLLKKQYIYNSKQN